MQENATASEIPGTLSHAMHAPAAAVWPLETRVLISISLKSLMQTLGQLYAPHCCLHLFLKLHTYTTNARPTSYVCKFQQIYGPDFAFIVYLGG